MKKYQIRLCLLGYQRYKETINKLCTYKSKLFEVVDCIEIKQLPPPDCDWTYTDKIICNLLTQKQLSNATVDLCLCFIDQPIECNYFTRDLSTFDDKTVLCSFYEVEDIFTRNNIDLFNYVHGIVLNSLVQIATLHKLNEKHFLHDDTRNCLFDMCGLKNNIAIKYNIPSLCPNCIAKIEAHAIEKEFIPLLQNEFKTFKKTPLLVMINFIKDKPILSIIITILSTTILNIISSALFEMIKLWGTILNT